MSYACTRACENCNVRWEHCLATWKLAYIKSRPESSMAFTLHSTIIEHQFCDIRCHFTVSDTGPSLFRGSPDIGCPYAHSNYYYFVCSHLRPFCLIAYRCCRSNPQCRNCVLFWFRPFVPLQVVLSPGLCHSLCSQATVLGKRVS